MNNISKNTVFLTILALCSSSVFTKSSIVQSDIFYEITKGNVRAVKSWLKTSPDLSVKNEHGQTLLGYAVANKKSSVAKLLIKAGVNINQVDNFGKTALDYTVEQQKGSLCLMLFNKGAKLGSAVHLNDLNLLLKKQTSVWKKVLIGVGIVTLVGASIFGLGVTIFCIELCVLFKFTTQSIVLVVSFGIGSSIAIAGTYFTASRVKYNRLKRYDFDTNSCIVSI